MSAVMFMKITLKCEGHNKNKNNNDHVMLMLLLLMMVISYDNYKNVSNKYVQWLLSTISPSLYFRVILFSEIP